jgi:hypothetical protein
VKTELAADNPLTSGLPAEMRLLLLHTAPRTSLLSPSLKTVAVAVEDLVVTSCARELAASL